MRPLRAPAISLGVAYLLGVVLLGPLLGSSADASTAYAAHYAEDANVLRDLIGSLSLVVAAAMLGWTTIAARRVGGPSNSTLTDDLTAAAGSVSASVILVAAGLLATVPLTTAIGDLTDDPGIDIDVQAGIAQAGTVVFLVGALTLAATTVLLARLGRQQTAVPRWISVTAWIASGALLLGAAVAPLLLFGVWAVALGLSWAGPQREAHTLDE